MSGPPTSLDSTLRRILEVGEIMRGVVDFLCDCPFVQKEPLERITSSCPLVVGSKAYR